MREELKEQFLNNIEEFMEELKGSIDKFNWDRDHEVTVKELQEQMLVICNLMYKILDWSR